MEVNFKVGIGKYVEFVSHNQTDECILSNYCWMSSRMLTIQKSKNWIQ